MLKSGGFYEKEHVLFFATASEKCGSRKRSNSSSYNSMLQFDSRPLHGGVD